MCLPSDFSTCVGPEVRAGVGKALHYPNGPVHITVHVDGICSDGWTDADTRQAIVACISAGHEPRVSPHEVVAHGTRGLDVGVIGDMRLPRIVPSTERFTQRQVTAERHGIVAVRA